MYESSKAEDSPKVALFTCPGNSMEICPFLHNDFWATVLLRVGVKMVQKVIHVVNEPMDSRQSSQQLTHSTCNNMLSVYASH